MTQYVGQPDTKLCYQCGCYAATKSKSMESPRRQQIGISTQSPQMGLPGSVTVYLCNKCYPYVSSISVKLTRNQSKLTGDYFTKPSIFSGLFVLFSGVIIPTTLAGFMALRCLFAKNIGIQSNAGSLVVIAALLIPTMIRASNLPPGFELKNLPIAKEEGVFVAVVFLGYVLFNVLPAVLCFKALHRIEPNDRNSILNRILPLCIPVIGLFFSVRLHFRILNSTKIWLETLGKEPPENCDRELALGYCSCIAAAPIFGPISIPGALVYFTLLHIRLFVLTASANDPTKMSDDRAKDIRSRFLNIPNQRRNLL